MAQDRIRSAPGNPSPMDQQHSGIGRVLHAWRTLEREQRRAAYAALALFATMFLPWYQTTATTGRGLASSDLSAFQVFSFVEAAVLLVAAFVLALLFYRAEGRAFHLPGGDGNVITAAGGWTIFLLVWRLFDKPGIATHGSAAGNVGVQWGIFFAIAAGGAIAYAGTRIRAAARPEPPLIGEPPRSPVVPPEGVPQPARIARDEAPTRRLGRRAARAALEDQLTIPLDPPAPEDRL